MTTKDIIASTLKLVDFSDIKFPGIAVYTHPLDYPGYYVARVWEMACATPTNIVIIRKELEVIMKDIKNNHI
jgi:hypothetical protein